LKQPLEDFACDQSLVLIFFGANDAALKEQDSHHYVPVELFTQNMKTLIERVQTKYPHCGKNILIITPPPVQHEQRLAFQIQKYGDKASGILERTLENTGKYAAACQSVAAESNLPCLNLYDGMQKDPDWARLLSDGLHFSDEGHVFAGEAILNAINEHFPKWKVTKDPWTGQWSNSGSQCEGLPTGGPYHDEIDQMDPDKAFQKHFG
jgi:lysophospholipase L1-like esterase